jgi:hypothetical protein
MNQKSKLSQFIKDYKSNPESPDSPFIAPSDKINLEKFLSGEKKFTDNIGYNQTETAVEKALGVKPKKQLILYQRVHQPKRNQLPQNLKQKNQLLQVKRKTSR